jgi:hypothetical protein
MWYAQKQQPENRSSNEIDNRSTPVGCVVAKTRNLGTGTNFSDFPVNQDLVVQFTFGVSTLNESVEMGLSDGLSSDNWRRVPLRSTGKTQLREHTRLGAVEAEHHRQVESTNYSG